MKDSGGTAVVEGDRGGELAGDLLDKLMDPASDMRGVWGKQRTSKVLGSKGGKVRVSSGV